MTERRTGGLVEAVRGRPPALAGVVALLLISIFVVVLARRRDPTSLDPRPPATRSDILPGEAPTSVLSVPVALPVALLVGLLEDAVPTTHGTTDSLLALPDQGRASAAIALTRGPFSASVVGDLARIATTIRYSLQVSYDLPALPDPGGSCGFGDTRPGLAVTLRSPVSLSPTWGLVTRAEVVEVRPASDFEVDRCEVTLFGVDVTERIVEGARGFLSDHLGDIDQRAADVDTRARFTDWWNTLQEPIQLSDSLWLAMGPETIRRGPVTGTGDSLRIDLTLGARPRLLLGPRPTLPPAPLPALDTGSVEPRLDLIVDGRAEYGTGSRFLTEQLAGTVRELGSTVLRLDSLRVYGIGGGRLALEVGVSGDLNGRLYFTGTPTIDAEASQISIPDLDLDVASENALFGIVPALIARGLRDFLREQASWPVDPAVRFLTEWLARGLNRDLSSDLRVAGTVDSVGIVGVYPLSEVLLVRVSARGSAALQIVE